MNTNKSEHYFKNENNLRYSSVNKKSSINCINDKSAYKKLDLGCSKTSKLMKYNYPFEYENKILTKKFMYEKSLSNSNNYTNNSIAKYILKSSKKMGYSSEIGATIPATNTSVFNIKPIMGTLKTKYMGFPEENKLNVWDPVVGSNGKECNTIYDCIVSQGNITNPKTGLRNSAATHGIHPPKDTNKDKFDNIKPIIEQPIRSLSPEVERDYELAKTDSIELEVEDYFPANTNLQNQKHFDLDDQDYNMYHNNVEDSEYVISVPQKRILENSVSVRGLDALSLKLRDIERRVHRTGRIASRQAIFGWTSVVECQRPRSNARRRRKLRSANSDEGYFYDSDDSFICDSSHPPPEETVEGQEIIPHFTRSETTIATNQQSFIRFSSLLASPGLLAISNTTTTQPINISVHNSKIREALMELRDSVSKRYIGGDSHGKRSLLRCLRVIQGELSIDHRDPKGNPCTNLDLLRKEWQNTVWDANPWIRDHLLNDEFEEMWNETGGVRVVQQGLLKIITEVATLTGTKIEDLNQRCSAYLTSPTNKDRLDITSSTKLCDNNGTITTPVSNKIVQNGYTSDSNELYYSFSDNQKESKNTQNNSLNSDNKPVVKSEPQSKNMNRKSTKNTLKSIIYKEKNISKGRSNNILNILDKDKSESFKGLEYTSNPTPENSNSSTRCIFAINNEDIKNQRSSFCFTLDSLFNSETDIENDFKFFKKDESGMKQIKKEITSKRTSKTIVFPKKYQKKGTLQYKFIATRRDCLAMKSKKLYNSTNLNTLNNKDVSKFSFCDSNFYENRSENSEISCYYSKYSQPKLISSEKKVNMVTSETPVVIQFKNLEKEKKTKKSISQTKTTTVSSDSSECSTVDTKPETKVNVLDEFQSNHHMSKELEQELQDQKFSFSHHFDVQKVLVPIRYAGRIPEVNTKNVPQFIQKIYHNENNSRLENSESPYRKKVKEYKCKWHNSTVSLKDKLLIDPLAVYNAEHLNNGMAYQKRRKLKKNTKIGSQLAVLNRMRYYSNVLKNQDKIDSESNYYCTETHLIPADDITLLSLFRGDNSLKTQYLVLISYNYLSAKAYELLNRIKPEVLTYYAECLLESNDILPDEGSSLLELTSEYINNEVSEKEPIKTTTVNVQQYNEFKMFNYFVINNISIKSRVTNIFKSIFIFPLEQNSYPNLLIKLFTIKVIKNFNLLKNIYNLVKKKVLSILNLFNSNYSYLKNFYSISDSRIKTDTINDKSLYTKNKIHNFQRFREFFFLHEKNTLIENIHQNDIKIISNNIRYNIEKDGDISDFQLETDIDSNNIRYNIEKDRDISDFQLETDIDSNNIRYNIEKDGDISDFQLETDIDSNNIRYNIEKDRDISDFQSETDIDLVNNIDYYKIDISNDNIYSINPLISYDNKIFNRPKYSKEFIFAENDSIVSNKSSEDYVDILNDRYHLSSCKVDDNDDINYKNSTISNNVSIKNHQRSKLINTLQSNIKPLNDNNQNNNNFITDHPLFQVFGNGHSLTYDDKITDIDTNQMLITRNRITELLDNVVNDSSDIDISEHDNLNECNSNCEINIKPELTSTNYMSDSLTNIISSEEDDLKSINLTQSNCLKKLDLINNMTESDQRDNSENNFDLADENILLFNTNERKLMEKHGFTGYLDFTKQFETDDQQIDMDLKHSIERDKVFQRSLALSIWNSFSVSSMENGYVVIYCDDDNKDEKLHNSNKDTHLCFADDTKDLFGAARPTQKTMAQLQELQNAVETWLENVRLYQCAPIASTLTLPERKAIAVKIKADKANAYVDEANTIRSKWRGSSPLTTQLRRLYSLLEQASSWPVSHMTQEGFIDSLTENSPKVIPPTPEEEDTWWRNINLSPWTVEVQQQCCHIIRLVLYMYKKVYDYDINQNYLWFALRDWLNVRGRCMTERRRCRRERDTPEVLKPVIDNYPSLCSVTGSVPTEKLKHGAPAMMPLLLGYCTGLNSNALPVRCILTRIISMSRCDIVVIDPGYIASGLPLYFSDLRSCVTSICRYQHARYDTYSAKSHSWCCNKFKSTPGNFCCVCNFIIKNPTLVNMHSNIKSKDASNNKSYSSNKENICNKSNNIFHEYSHHVGTLASTSLDINEVEKVNGLKKRKRSTSIKEEKHYKRTKSDLNKRKQNGEKTQESLEEFENLPEYLRLKAFIDALKIISYHPNACDCTAVKDLASYQVNTLEVEKMPNDTEIPESISTAFCSLLDNCYYSLNCKPCCKTKASLCSDYCNVANILKERDLLHVYSEFTVFTTWENSQKLPDVHKHACDVASRLAKCLPSEAEIQNTSISEYNTVTEWELRKRLLRVISDELTGKNASVWEVKKASVPVDRKGGYNSWGRSLARYVNQCLPQTGDQCETGDSFDGDTLFKLHHILAGIVHNSDRRNKFLEKNIDKEFYEFNLPDYYKIFRKLFSMYHRKIKEIPLSPYQEQLNKKKQSLFHLFSLARKDLDPIRFNKLIIPWNKLLSALTGDSSHESSKEFDISSESDEEISKCDMKNIVTCRSENTVADSNDSYKKVKKGKTIKFASESNNFDGKQNRQLFTIKKNKLKNVRCKKTLNMLTKGEIFHEYKKIDNFTLPCISQRILINKENTSKTKQSNMILKSKNEIIYPKKITDNLITKKQLFCYKKNINLQYELKTYKKIINNNVYCSGLSLNKLKNKNYIITKLINNFVTNLLQLDYKYNQNIRLYNEKHYIFYDLQSYFSYYNLNFLEYSNNKLNNLSDFLLLKKIFYRLRSKLYFKFINCSWNYITFSIFRDNISQMFYKLYKSSKHHFFTILNKLLRFKLSNINILDNIFLISSINRIIRDTNFDLIRNRKNKFSLKKNTYTYPIKFFHDTSQFNIYKKMKSYTYSTVLNNSTEDNYKIKIIKGSYNNSEVQIDYNYIKNHVLSRLNIYNKYTTNQILYMLNMKFAINELLPKTLINKHYNINRRLINSFKPLNIVKSTFSNHFIITKNRQSNKITISKHFKTLKVISSKSGINKLHTSVERYWSKKYLRLKIINKNIQYLTSTSLLTDISPCLYPIKKYDNKINDRFIKSEIYFLKPYHNNVSFADSFPTFKYTSDNSKHLEMIYNICKNIHTLNYHTKDNLQISIYQRYLNSTENFGLYFNPNKSLKDFINKIYNESRAQKPAIYDSLAKIQKMPNKRNHLKTFELNNIIPNMQLLNKLPIKKHKKQNNSINSLSNNTNHTSLVFASDICKVPAVQRVFRSILGRIATSHLDKCKSLLEKEKYLEEALYLHHAKRTASMVTVRSVWMMCIICGEFRFLVGLIPTTLTCKCLGLKCTDPCDYGVILCGSGYVANSNTAGISSTPFPPGSEFIGHIINYDRSTPAPMPQIPTYKTRRR